LFVRGSLGASTLFANAFPPHRCNHKENVNGALFVIIKSICFCNFVGFHKSSASKKKCTYHLHYLSLYFWQHQCHNFFKLKKCIRSSFQPFLK
jgi:hypothetical protein